MEAFQEAAEDGYRLLFFGDPSSNGSVEEINQWLTTHEGKRWENDKTIVVAKAINYLRQEFNARLLYGGGEREVPCTICTDRLSNGTRRFALKSEGQPQKSFKSSVKLPKLRVV